MFCFLFLTLKLLRFRDNGVVLKISDPVFAWKGVSDSWLSGSSWFKVSGSRMWAAQVLLEVVTVTWLQTLARVWICTFQIHFTHIRLTKIVQPSDCHAGRHSGFTPCLIKTQSLWLNIPARYLQTRSWDTETGKVFLSLLLEYASLWLLFFSFLFFISFPAL